MDKKTNDVDERKRERERETQTEKNDSFNLHGFLMIQEKEKRINRKMEKRID